MRQTRQTDVNIGGRLLVVRWTLGGLDEIEDMLSGSLLEWMRRCIMEGWETARISHIARIFHIGARGGMNHGAPSPEDILELIIDEGMPQVVPKLLECLAPFVSTPDAIERHMESAQRGKSPAPEPSS